MPHYDVAVIGGGVSGLAASFYANRRGLKTALLEASHRLGGLIHTDLVRGCTLEAGPDSFLAAKPAVEQLAGELGISGELIDSNDAERRIFIARNGSLVPMPKGMVMMVPTDLEAVESSHLFGDETRRRFRSEEGTPPLDRPGDFSIGELVQSHFGDEALAYIAEPLLSGVYGGDPARLSARSVLPRFVEYERVYGSLILGARQETRTAGNGSLFRSFAGGMGRFISALEAEVRKHSVVLHRHALSIEPTTSGSYVVHCAEGGVSASQIVLAVPAYEAARLLASFNQRLAGQLSQIPYSSAILGTFLFDRSIFSHPLNGFGFLVPRPERKVIAAATWINTKFPSRVADGLVALRAFVVDPEAETWLQAADKEAGNAMLTDLCRFMGELGHPVYTGVYRWPKSMPQYTVGHRDRVNSVLEHICQYPGVHLVSNYLNGIGIPDCVKLAEETFTIP